MKYGVINNYINGQFKKPIKDQYMPVWGPYTSEEIASVSDSSSEDLDDLIQKIKPSAQIWANQWTLKKRCEIVLNYRHLLKERAQKIAKIISYENGKLISEALAEVHKSIELIEFSASLAQINANRIQTVSQGITCYEERQALGIVASITPFNFPSMVPHWTIATAMALGNLMILKPSEQTPVTASYLAQIWQEAGLPDGVLNIVNGGKDIVDALCIHPDISALSFVGSTPVAQSVYHKASCHNKRVLALGGAKNHIILLEDAHPQMAVDDIIASFLGMGGQRCMAASVLLCVGEVDHIIDKLVAKVSSLSASIDFPPLISLKAIDALKSYLSDSKIQGAQILVDGHNFSSPDAAGFYFGPSILEWKEKFPSTEIFGPTLDIYRCSSLEEAIHIQNQSPYGNAASVFTQNGPLADKILSQLSAGMKGINIGVPVPRDPFSFGGINHSKFGMGDITGLESLALWTNLIKTTKKWNPEDKKDWMS